MPLVGGWWIDTVLGSLACEQLVVGKELGGQLVVRVLGAVDAERVVKHLPEDSCRKGGSVGSLRLVDEALDLAIESDRDALATIDAPTSANEGSEAPRPAADPSLAHPPEHETEDVLWFTGPIRLVEEQLGRFASLRLCYDRGEIDVRIDFDTAEARAAWLSAFEHFRHELPDRVLGPSVLASNVWLRNAAVSQDGNTACRIRAADDGARMLGVTIARLLAP